MSFSPNLGRWIQEDPIDFEAGDPNLFRYEENNPLVSLDPTGLWPIAEQTYHFVDPAINRERGEPPRKGFIVATIRAWIEDAGASYKLHISISSRTPAHSVGNRQFPAGVNTATEWFIRNLARRLDPRRGDFRRPLRNPSNLDISSTPRPIRPAWVQFKVQSWPLTFRDLRFTLVVQGKAASSVEIDLAYKKSNVGCDEGSEKGLVTVMFIGPQDLGDDRDQPRKKWNENLRILNVAWDVYFDRANLSKDKINISQTPEGNPMGL